ncbi:hypothetical protein [Mycobacterium sp.]|uniref:hypothetical protein n=1 Tax=Mycobacterium sp. TaxID=1785 RepID=UPI003F99EEA6
MIAFDTLSSAAGQQMVIAAPVGCLGDPVDRAVMGSLARTLGDRAAVTSMSGCLRRRLDGGRSA